MGFVQDILRSLIDDEDDVDEPTPPEDEGQQMAGADQEIGRIILNKLEELVDEFSDRLEQYDEELQKLDARISEIETELEGEDDVDILQDQVEEIQQRLEEFSEVYEALSNDYNPLLGQQEQSSHDQQTTTPDVDDLYEQQYDQIVEQAGDVQAPTKPQQSDQQQNHDEQRQEQQRPTNPSQQPAQQHDTTAEPADEDDTERQPQNEHQEQPDNQGPSTDEPQQEQTTETTPPNTTQEQPASKPPQSKQTSAEQQTEEPQQPDAQPNHATTEASGETREIGDEQPADSGIEVEDHHSISPEDIDEDPDAEKQPRPEPPTTSDNEQPDKVADDEQATPDDQESVLDAPSQPDEEDAAVIKRIQQLPPRLRNEVIGSVIKRNPDLFPDTYTRRVTGEKRFFIGSLEPLECLADLLIILGDPDSELLFEEHVGPHNDDFANWIENGLDMPGLANQLRGTTDRDDYIATLLSQA
jgi:archaellum component FlaC